MTLQVESISKNYGQIVALHDVSLSVNSGVIFGLLGPNGAGKTSLIKIICGLLRPDEGRVVISGHSLWSGGHHEARARVGYGPQQFSLYGSLTVRENIEFFLRIRGNSGNAATARSVELLEELGLTAYSSQQANRLSGGWKQRLTLAVAVLHNPNLLVLDEPTAGMDSVSRRAIWDYVNELANRGVTCIVTTHYMDEAERCSQVGFLADGEIVAIGTPKELRSSELVTPRDTRRIMVEVNGETVSPKEWGRLDGVIEAVPFGEGWHVLLMSGLSNASIVSALCQKGSRNIEIKTIEATLEDSFVAYTLRRPIRVD